MNPTQNASLVMCNKNAAKEINFLNLLCYISKQQVIGCYSKLKLHG